MTTPEDERTHWDRLAADLANVGGGPGMPGPEHYTDMLELWCPFGSYAGPDHDPNVLVDLGCGVGRILNVMGAVYYGDRLHGVDISADMLSQVPRRANVTLHHSDGRDIPAEIGGVDFAWSVLMFQHIPQTAQAGYVRQVAERLAPDGRFVLQWVDRGADHDYSHPTPGPMMLKWAAEAGLGFLSMWRDEMVPVWLWAVWEKP